MAVSTDYLYGSPIRPWRVPHRNHMIIDYPDRDRIDGDYAFRIGNKYFVMVPYLRNDLFARPRAWEIMDGISKSIAKKCIPGCCADLEKMFNAESIEGPTPALLFSHRYTEAEGRRLEILLVRAFGYPVGWREVLYYRKVDPEIRLDGVLLGHLSEVIMKYRP